MELKDILNSKNETHQEEVYDLISRVKLQHQRNQLVHIEEIEDEHQEVLVRLNSIGNKLIGC